MALVAGLLRVLSYRAGSPLQQGVGDYFCPQFPFLNPIASPRSPGAGYFNPPSSFLNPVMGRSRQTGFCSRRVAGARAKLDFAPAKLWELAPIWILFSQSYEGSRQTGFCSRRVAGARAKLDSALAELRKVAPNWILLSQNCRSPRQSKFYSPLHRFAAFAPSSIASMFLGLPLSISNRKTVLTL